jgi:hypothetical protein
MAEREILLTDDELSREDKEALGVTLSQVNGCTYCEDLINSVVYGANEHELAELMRFRRQHEIADTRTRRLHSWALRSYDQSAEILFNPPFSASEAPEVIGTALMLNYFNRYVKVFFSGTPLIAPFSSTSLKSVLYRLTGVELRESVTRRLQPCRSIDFLAPVDLPFDLQWAAGNATIAAAVSRWAAVLQVAAEEYVPQAVRALVEAQIEAWQGAPMGLSRAWLNPKVAGQGLDEAETAAARLALLTALSPAQMSEDIIASYRQHIDGNASLIVTVAWAAFMAARRAADWLADKSGYFAYRRLPMAS